MTRTFNMLELLTSLFTLKSEVSVPEDPTLYQVTTYQHEYAGRILFQDGVVIKLKIGEMKVVKILKENIRKIAIHKEVTAGFN